MFGGAVYESGPGPLVRGRPEERAATLSLVESRLERPSESQ